MKRLKIHNKKMLAAAALFIFAAIFFDVTEKGARVMAAAYYQEDIGERLIRLHVLANSDSDEDQQLKMKVKEDIVDFAAPLFADSQSIEETRKIIHENMDNFRKIAKNRVSEEGFNYEVDVSCEKRYFPVKTYGKLTLPKGEYEALVVEIGEAKGKNWWCILFPPLCFVDAAYGYVPEDSREYLEDHLTEQEYAAIMDSDTEIEKVQVRFKIADVIKDWFAVE